ncbi:hypothetical protein ACNKHL_05945 [Shigella flexneri]
MDHAKRRPEAARQMKVGSEK